MELGMVKPVKPTIAFGSSEKTEEPKKGIDAKEKIDTFNKEVSGANEALKDTGKELGLFGTIATGLLATVKKPFLAIKEWAKEVARDENGNIIKILNDDGKEVIKKLDKFNKGKIIALAGAAIAGIGAFAISKIVKAKQAEKAEKEEKAEEEKQAREAQERREAEIARAEADKAIAEADKALAEAKTSKEDSDKEED